jgi:hypothetical protein
VPYEILHDSPSLTVLWPSHSKQKKRNKPLHRDEGRENNSERERENGLFRVFVVVCHFNVTGWSRTASSASLNELAQCKKNGGETCALRKRKLRAPAQQEREGRGGGGEGRRERLSGPKKRGVPSRWHTVHITTTVYEENTT